MMSWPITEYPVMKIVQIILYMPTGVTLSKSQGGLGVKRADLMNVCLLLKWWWRFGVEEKSLWKDVICKKYYGSTDEWSPARVRGGMMSKIWEDIVGIVVSKPEVLGFFNSNTTIELGDGLRAKFWLDNWAGSASLQELDRLKGMLLNAAELRVNVSDKLKWMADSSGMSAILPHHSVSVSANSTTNFPVAVAAGKPLLLFTFLVSSKTPQLFPLHFLSFN
ncbi:unnamed protein product [Camellia sinensis]